MVFTFYFVLVCFSMFVNSSCDATDRNCTDECTAGYWGDLCDLSCPSKCRKQMCNRDTGNCYGCDYGFYGNRCSKAGSDQKNGRCLYECVVGNVGETCENLCSLWCVEQKCDRRSGNCTDGCVSGWYGEHCDS